MVRTTLDRSTGRPDLVG